MIEVKVLKLVNKLHAATKNMTLAMLNKRSIRAIKKFNKLEDYISTSRSFLHDMEDKIEKDYQEEDAAINAAYKQAQSL